MMLPHFRAVACAAAVLLGAISTGAWAQPTVLEDFEDLSDWEVVASDGVVCEISSVPGLRGRAMRVAYDFSAGAGFCIVRRRVDLGLDPNHRFKLDVRGDGPANDLEFKLVSPSGDDVWWVNRRGFKAPGTWTTLTQKRRHFEFAWGPSAGTPMERVGWIELAIAASEGGSGALVLDTLTYEPLPDTEPRPDSPRVRTNAGEATFPLSMGSGGPAWVELSFPHPVEINACVIEWDGAAPDQYEVTLLLPDGERRTSWLSGGGTGRQGVLALETEVLGARIRLPPSSRGVLASARLCAIDESTDANAFVALLAEGSRAGRFPPAVSGVPTPWTVVGLPDDEHEALLTAAGDLELRKGGFTIRPELVSGGRVIAWADVESSCSLEDGTLPIPSVRWETSGLELNITALATPVEGASTLLARYRVRNTSGTPWSGRLVLSAVPFQALPPWQRLNLVGGHSPIRSVQAAPSGLRINARDVVRSLPPADGVAAGSIVAPSAGQRVRRDGMEEQAELVDLEHGFASGTLVYEVSLAPGAHEDVILSGVIGGGESEFTVESDPGAFFEDRLAQERDRWAGLLRTPRIDLPGRGGELANAARATTAHILINQDGPAIQPGSRTYERSWIRDGSITSLALIAGGHADRARALVDWYAPFQYESGKVPCVVDRRGPDPVDEHDSTGELMFVLWQTYLATGDRAFLARHEERVRRGVDYLRALRDQRLTGAYLNNADPIERAKAGLVPESISHEGYSAKPMHSYWDDFFVLRGLRDAASIAGELGAEADRASYAALADSFERSLFDSIQLTMRTHEIDFVPGCVELGDFDATSTSIAVFPGGLLGSEIDPALRATFQRYWEHFAARRDGEIEWRDFTPYEFRLVATFVRLGAPERALAMLEWLMEQRTPAGWNQWPEVGYRDPTTAGFVGDMPHTWVGSAFILSFYSLFAYEQGDALVIAPGLDPAWVEHPDGVRVRELHTRWGPLDYSIQPREEAVLMNISRAPAAPGGLLICPPPGDWTVVTQRGRALRPDGEGRFRVEATPGEIRFSRVAPP